MRLSLPRLKMPRLPGFGILVWLFTALKGWVACFERSRLAGVVFAGGVNERGDIAGHPSLAKAYEAGRSVGR